MDRGAAFGRVSKVRSGLRHDPVADGARAAAISSVTTVSASVARIIGGVEILTRHELGALEAWQRAFASRHKDRRYYEIVEDTLHPEFDYGYFGIRNAEGRVAAIQPFFLLDQDLLAGLDLRARRAVDRLRLYCPQLMRLRTLMVGCAAGEGHLDGSRECAAVNVGILARSIVAHARQLGAQLVVLKEFPQNYRRLLDPFVSAGFTRIPSMPMTRLSIAYPDFDGYSRQALNSATRRKLRKKFAAAATDLPIEMSVVSEIAPLIDEVYPLYLQVYDRARLRFEKLTKAYFCELGRRMPDKVRFFIWRRRGKIVAFGECLVHGDTFFAEYLGLDYEVALRLHLYHRVYRDIVSWAIAQGYTWFQSTGLNYDPKLHLRHLLEPVDLYVRGTSDVMNALLKRLLPLIEPTHYDATLPKFANYADLWDRPSP